MSTHDASQFASQAKGGGSFPVWYWNRYVLLELRRAATECLAQIGLSKQSRVLEFGCGSRPYERVVQECGAQYVAADLPGNPHADLVIGNDGRVPVPDGQYDAVLSIQVLEHVVDPAAYLAEVRRLLAPGGKLILSTHGIWVYHPVPLDLWRWTSSGLRKTLQDNGFQVEKFIGLLGMVPAGLQLIQDHMRLWLPKWARKPFVAIMQFLVARMDRFHSVRSRSQDAMIYMLVATPIKRLNDRLSS